MVSTYKNKNNEATTYKVGDMVPEDGFYICVPCGYEKYLKSGMRFGNCLSCLGKERKLFRKGLELWEKIFTKHKKINRYENYKR